MISTFAFLDSSFKVPQHLQMIAFNNFASKNNISISFYGNEPIGYEHRHKIFLEYLEKGKDSSYLFFTLNQFILNNFEIDYKIISQALKKSVKLFFASENLKIINKEDLKDIQLLLYSKSNLNLFK